MEEELCEFSGGFFDGEWGRRLPPSLHLRRLLQHRPEIFDWLKGSDARRVGSLGNDFDLLLQEVQGIVCYVGAG